MDFERKISCTHSLANKWQYRKFYSKRLCFVDVFQLHFIPFQCPFHWITVYLRIIVLKSRY